MKYSVYAVPADVTMGAAMSTTYDGIKGDYLLGVTYTPSYTLPSAYQDGYWYAVCVIDGYGNESEPAFLNMNGDQPDPVSYSIEKVWELNDISFLYTPDARQGFGMDGKFYINDKGSSTILVVDQNGLTGTTFEGGRNVGFTRDEAGNLVVSDAQFPDPWNTSSPSLKVINPTTGQVATHVLPAELTNFGRSDNMGFARGNLMQDGELYLVGAASGTSISRIRFIDGEIDTDESYLANCDGVNPNSGTVLNAYTDANGDEAVLYITRNAAPVKMLPDGDNFVGTAFSLPNKSSTNGAFPFVWNGVEYILYPTLNHYLDGFAVAQPNAATPLAYVPETVTVRTNEYQADWLNAEVVDCRNVTIYQYYPGGHITVWRLTKQGGVIRGDVNADGLVNISDVTALINYLLTGITTGIDPLNADCSLDGPINISDATTLINYLQNNIWPE